MFFNMESEPIEIHMLCGMACHLKSEVFYDLIDLIDVVVSMASKSFDVE